MAATLADIGLESCSATSSDDSEDDLANITRSSFVEAHDRTVDADAEADEDRETMAGGDEHGNLPGFIDYAYEGDDDASLHRRVTLEADERGNLPRPRQTSAKRVKPSISKADLAFDREWLQSGEKFDGSRTFPRPSKSSSRSL